MILAIALSMMLSFAAHAEEKDYSSLIAIEGSEFHSIDGSTTERFLCDDSDLNKRKRNCQLLTTLYTEDTYNEEAKIPDLSPEDWKERAERACSVAEGLKKDIADKSILKGRTAVLKKNLNEYEETCRCLKQKNVKSCLVKTYPKGKQKRISCYIRNFIKPVVLNQTDSGPWEGQTSKPDHCGLIYKLTIDVELHPLGKQNFFPVMTVQGVPGPDGAENDSECQSLAKNRRLLVLGEDKIKPSCEIIRIGR